MLTIKGNNRVVIDGLETPIVVNQYPIKTVAWDLDAESEITLPKERYHFTSEASLADFESDLKSVWAAK